MSTFSRLWAHHPTNEFPCATDGQRHFENQCAIRMGVCFERAGISTKQWPVRRCWQHKSSASHVLAAEELAAALNRVVVPGMRAVEKYDGVTGFEKIARRQGVVFFRNFYGPGMQGDHIDLWNGWRLTSLTSLVSIYTPWGSRYNKGSVWFWEVA